MRTSLSLLALPLLAALLPSVSDAQIVFTYAATAKSSGAGYVSGQSYTFQFVLNTQPLTEDTLDSFGSRAYRYQDSAFYIWKETAPSHTPLFTAVTGTGVSGSYSRANTPYSEIYVPGDPIGFGVELWVYSPADQNFGLTAPNGTSLLTSLQFKHRYQSQPQFLPMIWSDLPDANSYFATATSPTGIFDSLGRVYYNGYSNYLDFTVDSLSISTSAIPEPSTYALAAGVAALGVATVLRRRRSDRS